MKKYEQYGMVCCASTRDLDLKKTTTQISLCTCRRILYCSSCVCRTVL